MTNPRRALRDLMAGEPFIAADCYSALTARVVEHVGFTAAYMGGHATGMMHHAIPDNGVFAPAEMVEQAARVVGAVAIPVIVDADQAGESVADVHRSIRRYEQVGVAGVHIEDEQTPKHSTFDGPLLSIPEMQARITAAAEAKVDPDFVVIARCDELYVEGGGGAGSVEETIRRGVAYAEAGADVFLPTMATAEVFAAVAAEVPIPIAGYGPIEPGVSFSLFTGWGTAAAVRAHLEWARHLLEHGDVPMEAYEIPDKLVLTRQDEYDAVVRTWAERTGRATRTLP